MRTPALVPLLLLLTACDLGDSAREVTSGVVGSTVEATKGVADGVKDGIQEGRKNAQSTDGATVLSTAEEIKAATVLSVHAWEASAGGGKVTLAIENTTDKPLHLIGLSDEGGALVVDSEGFATPLKRQGSGTIVVPPMAKVKAELSFAGATSGVAMVRVWGQELDASAAKTAAVKGAEAAAGTAEATTE